jgi:hypothetical protein
MIMTDENENLEIFWDDLRIAPHRPPPKPTDFDVSIQPEDLIIGTSQHRILVLIKPDGTLTFGPEYRQDEAAMVFWEAMGQKRLEMEDRLLLIHHMEAILTRLGDADLQNEVAQLALRSDTSEEAQQRANQTNQNLERIVSQAIELGRGLIRRPDIPMPAIPADVPRSVQAAEHSSYQGQEGLEDD